MTLVTQEENFSEWYNQLVLQSGMAEHSAVRGCMIIKPYGYAVWENIRDILDVMFKITGHQNAYFPLLIPKSFLTKEEEHVDGFAKECAVVTHYRLKVDPITREVVVDPDAKLEEELIIRPTSETVVRHSFKNRIQSHRDLPLLINQWANVMRREMRTRLFLRTSEFLRQEGHTAHATQQEAEKETKTMLFVYHDFVKNFLAMHVFLGEKVAHERFAGALTTYTLEAMMQDKKALQAGTSHFLGQNFAKAFDVTFTNTANEKEHVRATSWGVSTRMIGGLIMSHSDNKGLVMPPAIAPLHVVIIPIAKTQEDLEKIAEYITPIVQVLEKERLTFYSQYFKQSIPLRFKVDDDLSRGFGWKATQYELQGVPLRLTIGKKEMENNQVEMTIRWSGEKKLIDIDALLPYIDKALYKIQNDLLKKHQSFSESNLHDAVDYQDFIKKIEDGFVRAHWDQTQATAEKIQKETGATIRCVAYNASGDTLEYANQTPGVCMITGLTSPRKVLFAKAY